MDGDGVVRPLRAVLSLASPLAAAEEQYVAVAQLRGFQRIDVQCLLRDIAATTHKVLFLFFFRRCVYIISFVVDISDYGPPFSVQFAADINSALTAGTDAPLDVTLSLIADVIKVRADSSSAIRRTLSCLIASRSSDVSICITGQQ